MFIYTHEQKMTMARAAVVIAIAEEEKKRTTGGRRRRRRRLWAQPWLKRRVEGSQFDRRNEWKQMP